MALRFSVLITCVACALWILPLEAKHDPFVVVTPPKTGTHLLTKTMEHLTGKKCQSIFYTNVLTFDEWQMKLNEAKAAGAFIQIHAHPTSDQIQSLKKLGYKVIFLMRDPRDQAVSLLFFIDKKNWAFGPLSLSREPYKSLSFDDKLLEIITGDRTGFSAIHKLFIKYIPWTYQKGQFVHTVRFEHLVGTEGGGTRAEQLKAVANIAHFLNMSLTDQQIEQRSKGLFGSPGEKTFRHGQIGEWRKYFKFSHQYEMQKRFGKEMLKFDYTNDPPEDPVKKQKKLAAKKLKQQKKESEIVIRVPKVK